MADFLEAGQDGPAWTERRECVPQHVTREPRSLIARMHIPRFIERCVLHLDVIEARQSDGLYPTDPWQPQIAKFQSESVFNLRAGSSGAVTPFWNVMGR